jgi:hypothetical protein
MKQIYCALGLIAASLLAPLLNAQELKQFTVDSLVAKNIEAKGGIEALRAVQSLQLKGKMLVNQGQIELTYTQTKKRPGQIRTEATLQGMTMVQAYDGTEGWKISRSEVEKILKKCRRMMRNHSSKMPRSMDHWSIGSKRKHRRISRPRRCGWHSWP